MHMVNERTIKKTEEFFNLFFISENSEQTLILELDLQKGCHLKATANNGAKTTSLVLCLPVFGMKTVCFFLNTQYIFMQ